MVCVYGVFVVSIKLLIAIGVSLAAAATSFSICNTVFCYDNADMEESGIQQQNCTCDRNNIRYS